MPPSYVHNEDLFFFNQHDNHRKIVPRAKKQFDEQTLANLTKKLSSKFQVSDAEQQLGFTRSLADRLNDLYTVNSGGSNHGSASSSAAGSRSSPVPPPQAFTDTRLQAIRFLTEDMIKELEETLQNFADTEEQPVLPGPIIYELHNDWADLTDGVDYKSFPVWQTRAGRDSMLKKSSLHSTGKTISRLTNATDALSVKKNDKDKENNAAVRANTTKNGKLSVISENRTKNVVSITKNLPESHKENSNRISSMNRKQSVAPNKTTQLEMISSRIGGANSASSSGCLLNYQLSNNQFKDRGWTVVAPNRDERMEDVERKILYFLNTANRDMFV